MPDTEPVNYSYQKGDLLISDRNFRDYMNEFNLSDEDISNLPRGSSVLNVGSGISRAFESELKAIRPDLNVFSIDPSLDVVSIDKNGDKITPDFNLLDVEKGKYFVYRPKENEVDSKEGQGYKNAVSYSGQEMIDKDEIRKKILTAIPGALAADAIDLPFKNESIDTLFDLWGPIMYLNTIEKKRKYLTEIRRVTKPTSKIYVSFLDDDEKKILDELGLRYSSTRSTEESWVILR